MAGPESLVPQQYLLGSAAPRPRTLWDIITTTAEMHPDAAALDDGEICVLYTSDAADEED